MLANPITVVGPELFNIYIYKLQKLRAGAETKTVSFLCRIKKTIPEFENHWISQIFTGNLNKPWLRAGLRLPGFVLVSCEHIE